MFKLAGIFCILTGCIGWGGSKIREERERVMHLRELIRIIRRIQNEVGYGKHTLPEICLILSEYSDISYQPFFKGIYEQTDQRSGVSLTEIWKRQMEQCLAKTPLDREEKDVLCNLPQNLGMQEEKQQAENIGQSLDLLMRRCRQAEDDYGNKSRMIFSVSLLVGIFLTILLL
ncbi:MAG: stage III sporulation protein AB [Ruminococcus flavefaciens]|nr:stage III sporulation protein AB [Eubacterium sp.]MCM1235739.1 stage III sporulation protein AB [Ruminococcus flavefaciens]